MACSEVRNISFKINTMLDMIVIVCGEFSCFFISETLCNFYETCVAVTTRVSNSYSVQQTGAASDVFTLELHLRYPPQQVWSIPNLAFLLKSAWIQYLSVLVLVAYLTSCIKHWVFSSRLLPAWIHYPKTADLSCK